MTILARPSLTIKNPRDIKAPVGFDEKCVLTEEKIMMYPSPPKASTRTPKRKPMSLSTLALLSILTMASGGFAGLMLYRQYLRGTARHYQGYCAIPIDFNDFKDELDAAVEAETNRINELKLNKERMMLNWSHEELQRHYNAPEEEKLKMLREEVDIGGSVESIRVLDNGRDITFIHDFNENTTGIMDTERCFLMDLNTDSVLEPNLFMVKIERGEKFDVTLVRSVLRAVLPALAERAKDASRTAGRCQGRPIYRLQRGEGGIRKRSADAPPHDYIQFSGNHVEEIEISNMAELLEHEKNNA